MNEVTFTCPECSQHISCDDSYRGDQVACPSCKTQIVVPQSEPDVKSPTPFRMETLAQDLRRLPSPRRLKILGLWISISIVVFIALRFIHTGEGDERQMPLVLLPVLILSLPGVLAAPVLGLLYALAWGVQFMFAPHTVRSGQESFQLQTPRPQAPAAADCRPMH